MEQLHPHYVVDAEGKCTQVVLDIGEFRKLMDCAGITVKNSAPTTAIDGVAELGWTREEAADTRQRLQSFDADWNAPGMDGYDSL